MKNLIRKIMAQFHTSKLFIPLVQYIPPIDMENQPDVWLASVVSVWARHWERWSGPETRLTIGRQYSWAIMSATRVMHEILLGQKEEHLMHYRKIKSQSHRPSLCLNRPKKVSKRAKSKLKKYFFSHNKTCNIIHFLLWLGEYFAPWISLLEQGPSMLPPKVYRTIISLLKNSLLFPKLDSKAYLRA